MWCHLANQINIFIMFLILFCCAEDRIKCHLYTRKYSNNDDDDLQSASEHKLR